MPYYAVTLNIHDLFERVGAKVYGDGKYTDSFIKRIRKIENVLGIIPLAATDRKIPIEITISYDGHKDRCRTYQQHPGLPHDRRTVNCQKAS